MMIEGFFVYGGLGMHRAVGGSPTSFPPPRWSGEFGEITADNKRIITMEWILRAFPHLDCCSDSDRECDKQVPQLVDALHQHVHRETAKDTDLVGAAA